MAPSRNKGTRDCRGNSTDEFYVPDSGGDTPEPPLTQRPGEGARPGEQILVSRGRGGAWLTQSNSTRQSFGATRRASISSGAVVTWLYAFAKTQKSTREK